MEKLDVFDCSNVFIASYFTDDKGCAHCNREHTLIYIHSGELEITDKGRKTILHSGDCAFMRRDNQMWLQKRVKDGKPYRSIVMKFSREYLKEFYQTFNRREIPKDAKREKLSLVKFPPNRKVSEICFDVGFKNLSHFSKLYKETYGMAPTYS